MSAPLSVAARELLARRAARASAARIPKRAPDGPAPLAPTQELHWALAQIAPGSSALNLPKRLRLEGPLDVPALARALSEIVVRQAVLRTVIRAPRGRAEQVVGEGKPIELAPTDLRGLPVGARAERAQRLLVESACEPFDLGRDLLMRPLLIRLDDDAWELQVTFHHIAFDGWSTGLFYEELSALYQAQVGDTACTLPALSVQFADVAAFEHARQGLPAYAASLAWWQERMAGAVSALDLAADEPGPDDEMTYAAGVLACTIGEPHCERLRALALAEKTTLFAVLAAALHVLVARRCGTDDPILGVVSAGRHLAAMEPLLGTFMKTLPLRAPIEQGRTFRAHLGAVQAAWIEASEHAQVHVQAHATTLFPAWSPAQGALFPVLLNFRNMPLAPPRLGAVEATIVATPPLGTTVDLLFEVSEGHDGLEIALVFSAARFAPSTAQRWLDGLRALLVAVAEDPHQQVALLPIMGSPERTLLLETWTANRHDAPTGLVHAPLFEHAARCPDAVAAVLGDDSLCYGELARRARSVAAWLNARGIGPGARVGLCAERSFDLLVGVFGILESGAALVALDLVHPPVRLGVIAADATLSALVTQSALIGCVAGWVGPTLLLDQEEGPTHESTAGQAPGSDIASHAPRGANPSDIAYVYYTSGSTGTPKGAMIEHGALVNLFAYRAELLGFGPESQVLQVATFGFDPAMNDILQCVRAGGCLVLLTRETLMTPRLIAGVMRRHRVTHAGFTPTLLAQVPDGDLPALRALSFHGEGAPRELYARWRRGRRVWNEYGPTECTIYASIEDVREEHTRVGVGAGIWNTRLYVLDERGEPVPIGVEGELWIAGRAVGRGYLGRDDLTAERFVADAFVHGERMYRTGDRARWLPRGSVQFLGRADRQLKIRGQRLEPGEVESVMRTHPMVVDAVVVCRESVAAEPSLVGYYTSHDGAPIAAVEMKEYLRVRLPSFMVPDLLVHLVRIPVSANGKVDRRALPAPLTGASTRPSPRLDPADPLTGLVFKIWQDLLPGREFGLDDDFLDVGGHSLLAARMAHEIAEATGFVMPLTAFLSGVSIAHIVRSISQQRLPEVLAGVALVQEGAPHRVPFFMLHNDYAGIGAYCRAMARAVGPEQPLYGLPPLRHDDSRSSESVEGIAERQLALIRQVRPNGPYRLGGYCLGGLVAFEIARRLEALGEVVDLLLLVDSRPHSTQGWHAGFVQRLARIGARKPRTRDRIEEALLPRIQTIRRLPPGELVRHLIRAATRVTQGRVGPPAPSGPPELDRIEGEFRRYVRLAKRFVARPYRGRIDVLCGPFYHAHSDRWRAVSRELTVRRVELGHGEILWRALPGYFRSAIERLESGGVAASGPLR